MRKKTLKERQDKFADDSQRTLVNFVQNMNMLQTQADQLSRMSEELA